MKIATKKLSSIENFLSIAEENPLEGLRKYCKIGRKKTLGLLKSSYPILLSGTAGSGRSYALASIASQNIIDGVPFVYMSGNCDLSIYTMLNSIAAKHKRLEDLYIINFIGASHTFDPINPYIGDSDYFRAIFGSGFGTVLSDIFLCEKLDGELVDLSRISNYLSQSNLLQMLDQAKYKPASKSINKFLADSIDDREQQMEQAKRFVSIMERSSVFSTNPDVHLQRLFDRKKFLHIVLPSICKLEPACSILLISMFGYLLAKAEVKNSETSAHVSIILDECLPSIDINEDILSSLGRKNTIFSYDNIPSEDAAGFRNFRSITRTSNSVIMMKHELYDGIPDVLRVSALLHGVTNPHNIRCIKHQEVGQCHVWGSLGIDSGDRRLVGAGYFTFMFAGVEHVENISLNTKPIEG